MVMEFLKVRLMNAAHPLSNTFLVLGALSVVGAVWLIYQLRSVIRFIWEEFLRRSCDIPARYGPHTWVLITGSTAGIGREMAHQFAKLGFNIVLFGRNQQKLDTVSEEVKGIHGVQTKTVLADFRKCVEGGDQYWDDIMKQLENTDISIVVNNAGTIDRDNYESQKEKRIHRMLQVNLIAPTILTRRLIPQLLERAKKSNGALRSALINVSSSAGMAGLPYYAIYGGTKAYLFNFSQALFHEFRNHIDVVCWTPSTIATKINGMKPGFRVLTVQRAVKSFMKDLGYEHHTWGNWIHRWTGGILQKHADNTNLQFKMSVPELEIQREREKKGEISD